MFIHRLEVTENEDKSPNLKVVLMDPTSSSHINIELKKIDRVEFQEENIGTEEHPNIETMWTFFAFMQDTLYGLDFVASEGNRMELFFLLPGANVQVKSNFVITTDSNILEHINDVFNFVEESIQEYNSKQAVETPKYITHKY
jgi:hypothetical protein